MYNNGFDYLEYIERQKRFLHYSLRFEELLTRLITIYKNRFTRYSNKFNNSSNYSIEMNNKMGDRIHILLSRFGEKIERLSSKLDRLRKWNLRKTNELNETLIEYKNRFNVDLETIKLEEN